MNLQSGIGLISPAEVQIRRSIQFFSQQYLSYYPTKPYDVGTQKNRLETILLSTHNIGLEGQIRILEHAKRPLSRDLRLQLEKIKTTGKQIALTSLRVKLNVFWSLNRRLRSPSRGINCLVYGYHMILKTAAVNTPNSI